MFKDYYKILNINRYSNSEQIKNSYRKLAMEYHPDRNFGDKSMEEKFKSINEAYEILSNINKKIIYDSEYDKYFKTKNETKNNKVEITPQFFVDELTEIKRKLKWIDNDSLNQSSLFESIKNLFSEDVIKYLNLYSNSKTNKLIIEISLSILNRLNRKYIDEICLKLSKIANGDNELINIIYRYSKKRKSVLQFALIIKYFVNGIFICFGIFLLYALFYPKSIDRNLNLSEKTNIKNVESGELFVDSNISSQNDSINILNKYSDWDKKRYKTGSTPACFNYTPKYNYEIDNYFEIKNTTEVDAVVKLMKKNNNKCIRYVYIKKGDTYTIRNIPLGTYYTKIAYGNDWRQKIIDGKCIGKFIFRATYKNDLKEGTFIDFYIKEEKQYDNNGDINVISYLMNKTMKLYEIRTKYSYDSKSTDEDDFNADN